MSNTNNLEQHIANLQINHGDNTIKVVKSGKKVGPAVPPKPKKCQPQIPQSYSIKTAPMPSYSTVLNNTGINEKSTNLYMNSPSPYVPMNMEKNDFNIPTLTNGKETVKLYQNNENFYVHQTKEKFEPKYGYDEKNYYSNVGNLPAPQVPVEDRNDRSTNSAVYSNVESPSPISVPAQKKTEKDIIYSNIQWNPKSENTYSNIPPSHTNDDLPPPPEPSEYVACIPGNSFPPPPEELPPPPSPVSSSYSELRRATYQTDFPAGNYPNDIYGPSSQSSSTYESIYEPINPRPPSQLSCNYSMYSGYGSATSTQPQGKVSPVKEVDVLTDLLVQGMSDNSEESDIYGICAQCGCKVEGEGTGCSAMDKVFHINCFCCYVCKVNLQGKPFYSLEGKPYCEEDYLNTLEKCCVCTRPILDRILRATGKPYHPSCFTCVVCGQSLDGIPFTVDATNQIHCIQCFHKKFAPRCCVCKLPIMPEPGQEETIRVVALDRSFHIQCYKCEDCGLILSSDLEGHGCYPLDDHVLCKSCNASRVQALTSHMTTEL
ncbi:PREDICTED: thyroid receptor-interacting protein 6 isoform X1 [Polistes canadensis]|uniref:thyroid receptor-interacting protein 6 isoform X1 n=1 Tax=Polistes canadensis TaxID=91411 RepID=UPI000718CBE1|nr:PREDICTED: thyroid receptor-interacting protein 6 isoform X1 [Polistes canadensis]XP_014615205.1 PREDICTED: thyroid receptor-interacting protein 6 isoform X1 [Polistes canadensis]XP_014615207.1 PREDICTED: thyroid receptor-interacting protein 6 isoform X1 [Polistes canadensis]